MPIYEYKCVACGQISEVMQKMSDPAPAACPACQEGPLNKIMSRTAFQLKGEGWYVTDFRDKKRPDAAKADAKPGGEGEAAAKPDAKADGAKAPAADAKAEPKPADSKAKAESAKPATPPAGS